jgi:hypothetical protein
LITRFPIPEEEATRFKEGLKDTKPTKPYAFVFGHGLWNDIDLSATLDWLDSILGYIVEKQPYLAEEKALWPRLMVTPNSAGVDKPDEWLITQGNKALALFENAVRVESNKRGIEHLGTWNATIQSNKYDGV